MLNFLKKKLSVIYVYLTNSRDPIVFLMALHIKEKRSFIFLINSETEIKNSVLFPLFLIPDIELTDSWLLIPNLKIMQARYVPQDMGYELRTR